MNGFANSAFLIAGGILILMGILFQRYTSRYDFMGMIFTSVWHIMRGRRSKDRLTEIEERLHEISSAGTVAGKARRVTSNVIGHFLAPIIGIISLICFVGGAVFIAVAVYAQ